METTNPAVTAVGPVDGVRKKPGLFEAALSSSIIHPNVASTYMYAVREASHVGSTWLQVHSAFTPHVNVNLCNDTPSYSNTLSFQSQSQELLPLRGDEPPIQGKP